MKVNYGPIFLGFMIISLVFVLGMTPTRVEGSEPISSDAKSSDNSKFSVGWFLGL